MTASKTPKPVRIGALADVERLVIARGEQVRLFPAQTQKARGHEQFLAAVAPILCEIPERRLAGFVEQPIC